MKGRIYSGIIFIVIFFSSCFIDPCSNLDCITDIHVGNFKIVRASDGTDLAFGPLRQYDKNQIKFFALKGNDTVFYKADITVMGNGFDTVFQVNFFPKTELAFLKLNSSDIDTLSISYKTYESKCCGIISEITGFKFNEAAIVQSIPGLTELKK
jgi:hypothetical protein